MSPTFQTRLAVVAVSISWCCAVNINTFEWPSVPSVYGPDHWVKAVDPEKKIIFLKKKVCAGDSPSVCHWEDDGTTVPSKVANEALPGWLETTAQQEEFDNSWFGNFLKKFPEERGAYGKRDIEDFMANGTSHGLDLRMNVFAGPPHWNFGTHVHRTMEYMTVLKGTLRENRGVGHIFDYKRYVDSPHEGNIDQESVPTGHLEINEAGSIHTTYTTDEGMMLLTFYNGVWFFGVNACANPGIVCTPNGCGKSPNNQTMEDYCPPSYEAATQREMTNTEDFYEAFNKSDVKNVLSYFAPDAMYIHQGFPTARGTEQLRILFQAIFVSLSYRVTFKTIDIQVSTPPVGSGHTIGVQVFLVHRRSWLGDGEHTSETWRDLFFSKHGQIFAMMSIKGSPSDPHPENTRTILDAAVNGSLEVEERRVLNVVEEFFDAVGRQEVEPVLDFFWDDFYYMAAFDPKDKVPWACKYSTDCATAPLLDSKEELESYSKAIAHGYYNDRHAVRDFWVYGNLALVHTRTNGCHGAAMNPPGSKPTPQRGMLMLVRREGVWKIKDFMQVKDSPLDLSPVAAPVDRCPPLLLGAPDSIVPSNVKSALLVVGTESLKLQATQDLNLNRHGYADSIFKDRLEAQGFDVVLVDDAKVTRQLCERFDVMLVSSSCWGLHNTVLNNCTTPQMIWAEQVWASNGMTGLVPGRDYWVTAANRFTTLPKDGINGAWPPLPTGTKIHITDNGAHTPLAAGLPSRDVDFYDDFGFGMNWVFISSLGSGINVTAVLPKKTAPMANEPKAVLFYYEKGAQLYGAHGRSPALRIGFTPHHYVHGADPSCEELTEGQIACNGCSQCKSAAEMKQGANPMPLSPNGIKILDAAIKMLDDEAAKIGKLTMNVQV